MTTGTDARERYLAAVDRLRPGAVLTRKGRVLWTVITARSTEHSLKLGLRAGRHTRTVYVPLTHYGPCLFDVGLRVHAEPARQMALLGAAHS